MTVFQALPIARAPTRPGAAAAVRDEGELEAEIRPGAELVSLEDAEAGEKVEAAAEEDLEVEDAPADDATFLEEEEEGRTTTSPDLIDGDLEHDEES